jgi:Cys-tRNA(Pro) deacylase
MSSRLPMTQAMRVLREHGVAFEPHEYAYVEKGGTRASSEALGVDEHAVVKTLVFEDERGEPMLVLMHGDREVSAKALARLRGVKRVAPCRPEVADRHSGYQVGGTSPFGTRRAMPVYMERSILDLPRMWINGGRRGFLISLSPADAARVLAPIVAELATDSTPREP